MENKTFLENTNKYKPSQYNYLIDYNNKKLLFNGMTGAGFCLSTSEAERLSTSMMDISEFKNQYPSDFKKLCELGYIINDDLNEISYLKFKNKESVFLDKSCQITINPTMECNFRCWYCYEEHNNGRMTDKTMKSIKKYFKQIVENKEISSLHLSWFGGEPLLYFDEIVYPLARYAKDICMKNNIPFFSSITTNAFCINERMIEKFKEINLKSFQITLDGDRERHDKIRNNEGKPSYDIIIKNIILLCESIEDIYLALRINYDNQTLKRPSIDEILSEFDEKHRSKIKIDLQRVWQTASKTDNNITNEELDTFVEKIKTNGYKCTCSGGLTPGRFHNCYVSKFDFACINYDGNVYKCTARPFTEDYCVGKLLDNGTIDWDISKISDLYASSTFDNEKCLQCVYLPLCLGPCPQKIVENGFSVKNICPLESIERSPKDMIIDLYETSLKNKMKMKK